MQYRGSSVSAGARLALVSVVALAACVGGEGGEDAGAGTDAGGLAVCDLLTDAEVAGVLPGHDGGIVTSDGGSLISGVSTWQCSYTAQGENPADFDLLTVIVSVASTAEAFEEIRPNPGLKSQMYDNLAEIAVGDGGITYGDPGDTMVDVWQGMTVVSFELVREGAGSSSEPLAALAASALTKAMM